MAVSFLRRAPRRRNFRASSARSRLSGPLAVERLEDRTLLACVVPPSGLVSWWPLAGNANDIQDGNTGTLAGSGGQFLAAKVGLGFKSGGQGSLVLVPDAANLDVTQLTIDAWIRLDAINSFNEPIVWKGDRFGADVTSPYAFGVLGTDSGFGGQQFVLLSNGSATQGLRSSSVLPIGAFSHLALKCPIFH